MDLRILYDMLSKKYTESELHLELVYIGIKSYLRGIPDHVYPYSKFHLGPFSRFNVKKYNTNIQTL